MTDLNTHYKDLAGTCNNILHESLQAEKLSIIARSHAAIFDFTNWLNIIENRPEYPIYKMAIREYQTALLSNTIGLYNQAFLGLRFFFERVLVAILFSSKEIDLRLWQRGERDTYWQEIIDENTGIFSSNFCRAFFPEIKDELIHFRRMAQKVYRECSEYVHGNLSVQERIPETLIYNEFLFDEWHSKAEVMKRVILFSLTLRYINDVKINDLSKVESMLIEEFGYISAIRNLFGPTSNQN